MHPPAQVLITHTDAPELYVWNVDKQPNQTRGAVRGPAAAACARRGATRRVAPLACARTYPPPPARAAPRPRPQDKKWPAPSVAEAVLVGHARVDGEDGEAPPPFFALSTSRRAAQGAARPARA